MVKNTVKSFERLNKFHTYLTRETLPAEERVSKFHNHGKTPSYPCEMAFGIPKNS